MKFEGWRTEELQFLASLIAGRELEFHKGRISELLYGQLIIEIRRRRTVADDFQLKLGDKIR